MKMPSSPRVLSDHEHRRLVAFEKLAATEGLQPIQLMDLYDVAQWRWETIAGDVINGFAECDEDPIATYDGDSDYLVAESVFACGVDDTLRPEHWTREDFKERMAFLCERGSRHEYRVIEIARAAIKASGWSLY